MKTINAMMLSLAALTIAGCSQNEVTEISPDAHPQVGFGVYTGVPTRGVDMTTESMKDDPTDANKYGGFGIMAYFTGQDNFETVKTTVTPSFMHNQMVKFDGTNNVWTYSPVKYWPNRQNDKISFFAYAPYESDWQNGSKSGVITSAATAPGIPTSSLSSKQRTNSTRWWILWLPTSVTKRIRPKMEARSALPSSIRSRVSPSAHSWEPVTSMVWTVRTVSFISPTCGL